MADLDHLDLSLSDALGDSPPPGVEEPVVQTDFIASLEAEKFDDIVGETVGKSDYRPLLDNDEEAKSNTLFGFACEQAVCRCAELETDPVRVCLAGSAASENAVLENGEHDGQEAQKTGKRSTVYRTWGLEPENTSDTALDRGSQTFPTHDPPEEGGSVQGPTVTETVGNTLRSNRKTYHHKPSQQRWK
ncbi:UNVERIFIED_CONTAM: hypothetical protein FKN15_063927 [Acipenser sinensis]